MTKSIHTKLIEKEVKLAVIGLGYVGLPIALEFAKKIKVIGFDISEKRIKMMRNNIDPSQELNAENFKNRDIKFTSNIDDLQDVSFYIVAVPTPIDEANLPNLTPLRSAAKTIGKVIQKGDYVVFESTVFPGCTEEECIPIIEKVSGLKMGEDFKAGYSPERINPGDTQHTLQNVVKIVSGSDEEALEEIAKVYEEVVVAGVHRASSIQVAEAAKIIENTQRDVNIALINELSKIFNRLKINTYEVLEAAGTKWNFLPFRPGLVGGHCIGVDPYYLTHKAKEVGYHAKIIDSGREINDSMGFYVGKQLVKMMIAQGKDMNHTKVLVMGATFKENVSDIRNSKVIDIIRELQSFSVQVDVVDPYATSTEFEKNYGVQLSEKPHQNHYDGIIVAVNHKEYLSLQEDDFIQFFQQDQGIFIDIKGIYPNYFKNGDIKYWSL